MSASGGKNWNVEIAEISIDVVSTKNNKTFIISNSFIITHVVSNLSWLKLLSFTGFTVKLLPHSFKMKLGAAFYKCTV
jgi:hypothetical protein